MSSSCCGHVGSAGRGAGEGIACLGGTQNLSRRLMLFFICPLKTGITAGRGRVRRGTWVIISTVGIITPGILTSGNLLSRNLHSVLIVFFFLLFCN